MGIGAKDAGAWKPNIPYVRNSGSWKIPRGYVRQSGVWVPAYALQPLSRTLADLKLSTDLKLCLDAGDIASLPAASTKWLDTSGNGYDFNRGSTTSGESSDPTIVGTPGGLSSGEYLSFDGGDYLTYDTTNEAWMQTLHKNNAVFTVSFWGYYPSGGVGSATARGPLGTLGGGSNTGMSWFNGSTDKFSVTVRNSGADCLSTPSTAMVPDKGTWGMYSVTLAEALGAAGGAQYKNGALVETFDATYASPSTGNATGVMQIGAGGSSVAYFPSGMRLGQFCVWTRALTADELYALFQATRDRYGV